MTKILLCSIIISGFSFVGASLSKGEKKRSKTVGSLLNFVCHIEKEIIKRNSTFNEIMSSFKNKEKETESFFETLYDKKSDLTPYERLSKALEHIDKSENTDRALLELADVFDCFDTETQREKLERVKKLLIDEYEKQRAELNSKSKLYRSVSTLIGIAAAIVLY